jgi:hypothetical protein
VPDFVWLVGVEPVEPLANLFHQAELPVLLLKQKDDTVVAGSCAPEIKHYFPVLFSLKNS